MSSIAPADDMTHLHYEILGACLSDRLNQSGTEMRINAELAFSLKREM